MKIQASLKKQKFMLELLSVRLYFDRRPQCDVAARPVLIHVNTDPWLLLIETYLYRAAKSTSHSLNMKNEVWEGEGRVGERSMI